MTETQASADALLADLEVFFGTATEAEVSVYAQLPDGVLSDDLKLAGCVAGPSSNYAHTLQASVALHDLGPGATRLAEARVPDPCFWSPETPYVYEVTVEVRRGEEVLATAQQSLAIRRLGVDGRSLFLDAKRWVPRAARGSLASLEQVEIYRSAALGFIVDNPTDKLCEHATRDGILLAACTSDEPASVVDALKRLSRFGAVGLVMVENPPEDAEAMRRAARNVILCERRCDAGETPVASWADAVVYEVQDMKRAAAFAHDCPQPVIAWRSVDASEPLNARAECDALQRDLAPHGDFAGYFV